MRVDSGRRPLAGVEFRPSVTVALFLALTAAALIPIATHPLPPLSDYVNHLARMHIIDAIGSDADLSRYYVIQWELIPNLMMDLVVPALHRFMSVYLAGQVFTAFSFVLIASGVLVLNRVLIARWSLAPLLALPLLYNGVLFVGVMNYIFGIGLTLWALATWILLRDRYWPWRFAVSTLFALTLFFCHLFAAGLYGLGLLAYEIYRLWSQRAKPWTPRLTEFAASGLPFIPLAVLLIMGPTWQVDGASAYWEIEGKLDGLWLAVDAYYSEVTVVLLALSFFCAVIAWRRRILSLHPVGVATLIVAAVIYLAMPRVLFGAYLADQRLPAAVAFMLIACLNVKIETNVARAGLISMLVVVLAVRVVEVQLVWNHLQHFTDEFVQSVKAIKRGTRVLVVYGDRSAGKEVSDFELVHAASIATIERSAMVSTLFTVKGKQILHARKEFQKYVETEDHWPPSLPFILRVAGGDKAEVSYFWNDWPQHYDYVYVLFTTPDMRNPDRTHLGLVFDGSLFQLYRVLPTISAIGR